MNLHDIAFEKPDYTHPIYWVQNEIRSCRCLRESGFIHWGCAERYVSYPIYCECSICSRMGIQLPAYVHYVSSDNKYIRDDDQRMYCFDCFDNRCPRPGTRNVNPNFTLEM